jgi:hypothetical protein
MYSFIDLVCSFYDHVHYTTINYRPGYLKASTSSPVKAGRIAPRASKPRPFILYVSHHHIDDSTDGIIYEVDTATADGRYSLETAHQIYGEPRRNDIVFTIVTANEFGPQKQYEGDFNLSVQKVFILRKLM